jgi:hypothetical protein
MDHDALLRKQLVKLLTSSEAHADFEAAIKDLPTDLRGKVPPNAEHSPWQLVEHLRIALWDIVEFSRSAKHESPKWPDEYWPNSPEPPNEKAWDETVEAIRADLKVFAALISDKDTDLYGKIPHGDGQTILREVLLAADHNAYHVGQLVLIRRLLGAWK